MIRTLVVGLGVTAAVLGLALVVQPSLAVGLSPAHVVVTLVGVVGLVQAGGAAMSRVRGERREADLPDVERPRTFRTPGEEFDRTLAALPRRTSREADRDRAVVRERLREAAVGVLTRYGGQTPEAAAEHLDRGAWTDAEPAVAFFAPETGADRSFAARVRDAVGAERLFVRRARATVDALVAYAASRRTGTPTSEASANGSGEGDAENWNGSAEGERDDGGEHR